jgi:hypothetical protein
MSALAPDHDNPEVATLYRFEECRKCSSRLLVGYYYENRHG